MKLAKIHPKQSLSEKEGLFDVWNEEKKNTNKVKDAEKYPKPREIWLTKMGLNIGSEQNGKEKFTRPVLILKKIGNLYFCIALSTKNKESFFYRRLKTPQFISGFETKDSMLIVSQAKNFDKKRFIKQIGYISQEEFGEIKNLLKEVYF